MPLKWLNMLMYGNSHNKRPLRLRVSRRLKTCPCAFLIASLAACGGQEPARKSPAPASTTASPPQETAPAEGSRPTDAALQEFEVPNDSSPHDVAPARDGGVWYTAQGSGELGYLDPRTGRVREVRLGAGSVPHGVIVGPDGAPWITDGGLNAIVRVDPKTNEIRSFPLTGGDANLNTAAFDGRGTLWFTGQAGI